MKKINLVLAGLGGVMATVTPAICLTSCGDPVQDNEVTYSGSKSISTSATTYDLTFNLKKKLNASTGEYLKVYYYDLHGAVDPSIKKIEDTVITVTLDVSSSLRTENTFGLIFKCFNSSSGEITPLWSSSIPGFTYTIGE